MHQVAPLCAIRRADAGPGPGQRPGRLHAPPQALPERIAAYLSIAGQGEVPPGAHEDDIRRALDQVIALLRERNGNDFAHYKTNTLRRRIERRMVVHRFTSLDDYVAHLRSNPHELDLLFKELLIGVTNFFRDPAIWDALRTEAIPALLADHPQGRVLRAWVPACATGEEAYSLAIVFREALETLKPQAHFSLQIFATDLDGVNIELARKGRYPANIAANVSPERLARYFSPEEGGGYRLCNEIREMVVFATQNIVSDPPFTKLDLLSCRNLLIYFGAAL
jgi:two-component system CheB/CheR fusion protein